MSKNVKALIETFHMISQLEPAIGVLCSRSQAEKRRPTEKPKPAATTMSQATQMKPNRALVEKEENICPKWKRWLVEGNPREIKTVDGSRS